MNVYVINMDRDEGRLLVVGSRLRDLGVPYIRSCAIDAKELHPQELNAAVNRFRSWCALGRPIRRGEIGCAMSHYAIYKQISEPACVLEDDVILADEFPNVLDKVGEWIDPIKPQVVLLSNHSKDVQVSAGVFPASSDMYAEGYVITPAAAQALLAANRPMQRPCDHWGVWAKRGIIELYHAFPTVCSQDQSKYASGTVGDDCFRVSDLGAVCWLVHKGMRVIGKTLDAILPV